MNDIDQKSREWYAQHYQDGHKQWPLERVGRYIAAAAIVVLAVSGFTAVAKATSAVTGKWVINYVKAGTVVERIERDTEAEAKRVCVEERLPKPAVSTTRTSGYVKYSCQTLRYEATETFTANPVVPVLGAATISWTPPTQNTDGSALANLAGYRILYGTSQAALTQTIQVANSAISTYTVSNLSPATYYFAVKAYTTDGTESELSSVATKVIQ